MRSPADPSSPDKPDTLDTPVVEMLGIDKAFGGTPVLRGVDLRIPRGSVVGLVGENGAGKSTLVKILTGLYTRDGGTVRVDGEDADLQTPADAERHGIQVVHQDRHLAGRLTVAEQLFLGRRQARTMVRSKTAFRRQARQRLIELVGLDVPPSRLVEQLSVADQQLLQIARALLRRPRVLVLDEPTAPLAAAEVGRLHEAVAGLRDAGTSVLYISHYLREVEEVADSVVVLRNGARVGEVDVSGTGTSRVGEVVQLMVGREVSEFVARDPDTSVREEAAAPVLDLTGLGSGAALRDLDLVVRPGEIVGVTGLVGSGIETVGDAVAGVTPAVRRRGRVRVAGRPVGSARAFVRAGGAYVPADRRERGVFVDHTVRDNLTSVAVRRGVLDSLVPRRRVEEPVAADLVARMDVRPARTDAILGTLSGGNQQKVSLGKWLVDDRVAFVLDQPTAGVDVGSRAEIYARVRELVEAGAGVLLVSVDLDELVGLADRVVVLFRGEAVAEVAGDELSVGRLLELSSGAALGPEVPVADPVGVEKERVSA